MLFDIQKMEQWAVSVEEAQRWAIVCSHCCPNCDGPITVGEDEAGGICADCYFAEVGSTQ